MRTSRSSRSSITSSGDGAIYSSYFILGRQLVAGAPTISRSQESSGSECRASSSTGIAITPSFVMDSRVFYAPKSSRSSLQGGEVILRQLQHLPSGLIEGRGVGLE